MDNPDSSSKHGTADGLKRIDEIWIFADRDFATPPVALRPGIVGKQLAIQLKSPNALLRTL